MSKNNSKKSKLEIGAYIFAILGVIGAIIFSGYQAMYLRKDFILNMRPYIKIDVDGVIKEKLTFLSVPTVTRKNYFVYLDFKKNKSARLSMPTVKLTNIGRTPARIKDLKVVIRDVEEDWKFTQSLIRKIGERKLEYVIFPDGSFDWAVSFDFTPEADLKDDFNKKFTKLKELMESENFACDVVVTYSIFDETIDKETYFTYKAWLIEPSDKHISRMYYYNIK